MSDFDFPHPNDFDDLPPDVQISELKDRIEKLEGFIDEYCAQPDQTKVFDKFKKIDEENQQLKTSLKQLRTITDKQAEDEGLWFVAITAPEAYLQQELRKLHSAIEAAPAPDDELTPDYPIVEVLKAGLATKCEQAGAAKRIEELEAALREIVLYAKPKYRSTRDKLVRDGVCLSGELLHYESMPHVIHAGKKVLLREKE